MIYLRWKYKNAKNTNVNAVDGKPTVKDGKSSFGKWYSSILNYTRDPCKRTLPNESFIAGELTLCIKPTELQALIESPKLSVKTETVGYVHITSNWISEIQQCL